MRTAQGLRGCIALIAVLLVAGTYVALSVLGLDPRKGTYQVVITMDETGGLTDTAAVTRFGFEVGSLRSIQTHRNGVDVTLTIDDEVRIPVSSPVIVQNLSAAGEQYLDFRPERSGGPYLRDGSRIGPDQVETMPAVGSVLAKIDRLGELIDPGMVREMADLLVTVTSDDAALADAATTVDLMQSTIHDKTPVIRGLFRLAQELDERFMDMRGPDLLRPVDETLKRLNPALGSLLVQLGRFGEMSERTDVWTAEVGPFMTGLLERLGTIVPEFGHIAAALLPVTGQLRGIRVNANAFTDLWGQAFPPGGPLRVQVTVR
ncbi:MlaD family protein [Gordonia sp. HY002]|uniref:MlaD family protein n=1 Tax=Gordonia zhenghanii TaxID=2911516 RepID=UPI001EEFFF21|nr:MlaD family protein [Gordonia zhenghanii]MCF8571686.1 MlaD family protein [Gordonia zhenghanii]MCF8602709.1 MlaD family protein [Gordonia zhenghanii]